MSQRWVLHIDMDAFFASVEQLTQQHEAMGEGDHQLTLQVLHLWVDPGYLAGLVSRYLPSYSQSNLHGNRNHFLWGVDGGGHAL